MAAKEHIGHRVRAALARAVFFAFACALLAPVALGPAYGPVVGFLGGEAKHLCACGMIAGQCGCPECERAERQRHKDEAPKPYPVCKSQCGGDEAPVAYAPLPAAAPAAVLFTLPPRDVARVALRSPEPWTSAAPLEPPTPPPESQSVPS